MSEDAGSMLQLISLLGDDERYKSRLNELDKRTRDAETAEKRLAEAQSKHDSSKVEAEQFVSRREHELAAAQKKHDDAAAEAARRIILGNEQAAELVRVREENDRSDVLLEKRHHDQEAREKDLARRELDIEKRSQAVDSERTELKSRHERLRAAMG